MVEGDWNKNKNAKKEMTRVKNPAHSFLFEKAKDVYITDTVQSGPPRDG